MKNLLIETRLFEGKVNEDSNGRTLVKGILQRIWKILIKTKEFTQKKF